MTNAIGVHGLAGNRDALVRAFSSLRSAFDCDEVRPMKRVLLLLAVLSSTLVACGHCEGTAQSCSKDDDCPADSVCLQAQICGFEDCSTDAECQVAVTSVEAGCGQDGDCPTGEKCLLSFQGDLACITPRSPTPPCDQVANGFVDVGGLDADLKTTVHFCADGTVHCTGATHRKCKGGRFGT